MNKVDYVERWAESYLEVYEELHGPIVLHPDLDIEEVNMEWVQNFRNDDTKLQK